MLNFIIGHPHTLASPERSMLNRAKASKNVRSSRLEVFCKKGVLKIFTTFTAKHFC